MGPKMAGAFETIFMDKMQILDKGARLETLHGRHNLSLSNKNRYFINQIFEEANKPHQ